MYFNRVLHVISKVVSKVVNKDISKFWTVLVIAMIVPAAQAARGFEQAELKKNWSETFEFNQSELTETILTVDNINGGIEVMGYTGDKISVAVNVQLKGENQTDIELAEQEIKLLVEQTDKGLLLYLDTPFRDRSGRNFYRSRDYYYRYDFKIRVPENTDLNLSTVNHGDIAVKDMAANFSIGHVNGEVYLSGMSGAGTAKSVNGDVGIDYVQVPKQDTEVSTINGDIVISFGQKASTDVHLATKDGVLISDFDYQLLPVKGPEIIEVEGGLTRYVREPYTRIRIRNGGPVMKLKSFNGDIRIRKNTRSRNS